MTKTTRIIIAVCIATALTLILAFAVGLLLWQHFWNNTMSFDEAAAFALTDAGFTADEVSGLKGSLEEENGSAAYEIEFVAKDTKYEYTIDAKNGTVLQKESDTAPTQSTSVSLITAQQAKEIALTHAKVQEQDVQHLRVESDNEGGIPVYDIEFVAGNKEYEYEINAITGDILSHATEN